MVERNANWATLEESEKVEWLSNELGIPSTAGTFDANFIRECLLVLRGKIKQQFIKNIMSEVAAVTYKDLNPEQIASPEVRDKFYFACFTFDLELTGKCIYWAIRGEDV